MGSERNIFCRLQCRPGMASYEFSVLGCQHKLTGNAGGGIWGGVLGGPRGGCDRVATGGRSGLPEVPRRRSASRGRSVEIC